MKNIDAMARNAGPGNGRAARRPKAHAAIGSATRPLTVTSLKATLYGIGRATTVATAPATAIATRPRCSAGTTQPDTDRASISRTSGTHTMTLEGPSASRTTKSDGTTM